MTVKVLARESIYFMFVASSHTSEGTDLNV